MNTTRFLCHDDASAPREAGPAFEASTAKFGMVPNLIRAMCTSPQLAEGYLALSALFEPNQPVGGRAPRGAPHGQCPS